MAARAAVTETARKGLADRTEVVGGDFFAPVPPGDLMTMLALVPGQERSVTEYDALFEAAGLRRTTVRSTNAPHSVIEAVGV